MNFSFSVGIPQQKTQGVKHLEKPEYIIIHTYLINYRNLKKIVSWKIQSKIQKSCAMITNPFF